MERMMRFIWFGLRTVVSTTYIVRVVVAATKNDVRPANVFVDHSINDEYDKDDRQRSIER